MVQHKELLEWANVYGNWYGVPKQPIKQALDEGQDTIVKVDTQGNIYAVGYTTSLSLGYSDLLIVKYSPVGELIWEKKWGDANAEYCSFKRVSTLWRHIIRRSFAITTTKR